ncbi:hypothetical protein TrCOL_g12907 [Triparma columacea]|uniref:O-GlcNAc transferase C-terminal domain-containing protein n=1 Tax=Triparma columacea TaxID=722753 RepID=A0A9W7L9F0_9STRA|nr:hypothetical protein TrCOL_g12907 [Triparma columacea]
MGVCFHSLDPQLAHRMYLLAGKLGEGRFALPWVNAAVFEFYGGDGEKAERYLDLYFEGVGGWRYEGVGEGAWDEDAIRDGSPCDRRSSRVAECVLALNNLGASLNGRKKYSRAVEALSRALEIAGDGDASLPLMYANMASAQLELGDNIGAEESFTKGFRFQVEKLGDGEGAMAFLIRRALSLPKVISGEGKDILEVREAFKRRVEGVTKFAKWQRGEGEGLTAPETVTVFGYVPTGGWKDWPVLTVGDPIISLQTPHFWLSYHGFNDLEMQETVARMWRVVSPEVMHVGEGVEGRWKNIEGALEGGDGGRRKKIGFISSLFKINEPHGLLMSEVIGGLDRDVWEVVIIAIGGGTIDEVIHKRADSVVTLTYFHASSCSLLSSLKLDILVFLEMQNEATAHILGYGRFAPIQCLVMGSPVTAGNGGIDYFVSFERAEARMEDDYGEQLVLFQGLGISYPTPRYSWREMGRDEEEVMWSEVFRLPREFVGARKYSCGQHIFKLHPSFDDVIIGILERDREGVVLLQSSGEPATTDIVRARLSRKAGEDITGRILYLPRVSSQQFLDLLRYSDVILHPFPFGGSKTSSDAFWVGGRLVVMAGMGYLRGRMARAYYAEVGGEIEGDVVAVDVEDYIEKALRIGKNVDGVGDKVREVLERERERIFGDEGVREEWYRWLEGIVGHEGKRGEEEGDWDWEVVERIRAEWKGGFDVLGGS